MGGSTEDWRSVQTRLPGLSLPLDAAAASPPDCAEKLAGEVVVQVSGSFTLCGYSMGGRIGLLAAQMLLERKKKPEALILVSSGLGLATESERLERTRIDEEWAALAASDTEEFWKKWYEQGIFATFHALPENARKGWMEQRKSIEPASLASQLRNLGPGRHSELESVLKDILSKGVRVLYVVGDRDSKYVEFAERVRGFPGLQVDQIPGAGHILPLEAPEALAMRIAKFIR